ncbi:MAG TPA: kelch repeat-containing protein [Vicinamibacterales bacterium]|nr:kelch repeat-containing protein [Vicinamibacterales bacterium]
MTASAALGLAAGGDRPRIEAPGLVFDEARQRTVSFGGGFGAGMSEMTWEYDGRGWRRLDGPGPSRRNFHAMVYDRARRKVVLFGGGGPGGVALGDTWEYDGIAWKQVSTSGPPPRASHAMAYDRRRGRTVLYGGSGGVRQPDLQDTWEWNGAEWTRVATTAHPTGSSLHAMAFDEARSRTIAFGGRPASTETWAFDGRDWRLEADAAPGPRDHHAMTYAPDLQKVVLFGGWNFKDEAGQRDLWSFDGRRWTVIAASGPADYGAKPGLVYDSTSRRVLLLGTNGGETVAGFWQWDGRSWSAVR